MLAGARHRPSPLGQWRQMFDEEDRQRISGAEPRRPPAELLSGRRAPPAIRRVVDVDTPATHGGHVRRKVVALQREVAQPASPRDEVHEGGAGLGLPAAANAQKLQIVVLEEGDRVLRPPARMDAAVVDVEADLAVRLDAGLEIRHADHDVIDPGQCHAGLLSP